MYLFIQIYLYRVKTLLAFGYFAHVPCCMTCIYILCYHIFQTIIIYTIVTITKIEGTLDTLDHKQMIYAFELIE